MKEGWGSPTLLVRQREGGPPADLPRQITRGAALDRWRQARADGLTAQAAANAVGVPRSTLYRWQRLADRNRLKLCSRRPHTPRRSAWSAALVTAVQETRADYPMWGKIAVLLRRDGHAASESTTGRILKTLMERGAVTPVPSLRRNGPRTARRLRPYARRLPRGRKPTTPGEIVQLDTLSPHPDRPAQFAAHDPVGPAPRPRDAQPHTTPGASSTSSKSTCPSPSKPSRSTEAPSSRPTSMPAPRHRPPPAPIAQAQRTRRAQQRRLTIRVLRHMGPARRQPRPHQPMDRRLRRRVQHLQTRPHQGVQIWYGQTMNSYNLLIFKSLFD